MISPKFSLRSSLVWLLFLMFAGPSFAATVYDVTAGVPVRFWGSAYGRATTGPKAQVEVTGADFLAAGGGPASLDQSGETASTSDVWFDTTPDTLQMEPGKVYAVTVSGAFAGGTASAVALSAAPPLGYSIEIDYLARNRAVFDTSANHTFMVRLIGGQEAAFRAAGSATELMVGRIYWQVGLGGLRNGRAAGSISLVDVGVSADWSALFSPSALEYEAPSDEIVVLRSAGYVIRQIIANQSVVDVVPVSATQYDIGFYHPDQVASGSGTTLRTFSGQPYLSYRVEQGATATTLKLTAVTRNTNAANSWTAAAANTVVTTLARTGTDKTNFIWTRQQWNTDGAAQVAEQVTTAGGTLADRTDTLATRTPGSGTNAGYRARTYHLYAWGEEMTGDTAGSTDPVASGYEYYDNAVEVGRHGYLKAATATGGGWESYDYWDATSPVGTKRIGTLRFRYRPFGSTATATGFNATAGEVTNYDYADDPFGVASRPATVETRVDNVITARATTSYAESTGPIAGTTVVAATRLDYSQAGSSLTTVTKYFREDTADLFLRGQVHSVTRPDNVKVSFAYQRGDLSGTAFTPNDAGVASRIATITGIAGTGYASYGGYDIDDLSLVAGKSTLEVTIRNSRALLVRTESHAWVSGAWQLVGWVNYTYDTFGQLTGSEASNGATTTAVYDGNRKQYEVDQAGGRVDYEYDAAGRLWKAKKRNADNSGFTTTTTLAYDAAGRSTSETVSDGSENLTTSRSYDDAGRLRGETPLNLTPAAGQTHALVHTYNPATRQHTVTNAEGNTRTETLRPDGRLEKIEGTAVVASYYDYGIEADGRAWSKTTQGEVGSDRQVKSWSDWLGRAIRTEQPGFSLSVPAPQPLRVTENFYDDATVGAGRLYKTTRTGLAPTYFVYDELGQATRTGLDLDAVPNGLGNASDDRITEQNQYVEPFAGDYWLTTETKIYPTATAVTASVTRQRLTGFPANRRAETRQWSIEEIGAETPAGTVTLDVNPATKTVTTTTSAAGLAASAIATTVNGLAVSTQTPDGLTYVAQYDSLERAKRQKDPRHTTGAGDLGYTVYHYKPGTTLVQSVIDPTGQTVATSEYDNFGRVVRAQNALGQSVRTSYKERGQVWRQWGDATYPVEYGYDAVFGQQTAMSTFRGAPAGDAAAWPSVGAADTTTWAYDEATGLPWKKTDAAGHEVEFDYNATGQLASRKLARYLTATGHTSERVTASYEYYPGTGELKKVSYNDGVEEIPTPDVTYTYTRLGQVKQVEESTAKGGAGIRVFGYDPAKPWRLEKETLPAFFGTRVLTRRYEAATSASAGAFGGYTRGTVQGRLAGFELGDAGDTDRDLGDGWVFSNQGRLVGTTAATAGGTAADFVYAYEANSTLLDGYTRGDFSVSRDYEARRDLVTRLETKFGSGGSATLARIDYGHDALGRREWMQQSGAAFAAYTTGQAYASIYHRYGYNARNELESDRTYGGNDPAQTVNELPGRRLEYRYDALGNRKSSGATGSGNAVLNDSGAGDDEYAVNSLNQYTVRENNAVRVTGLVAGNAQVAVSGTMSTPRVDNAWGNTVVPGNVGGPAVGQVTAWAAATGSTPPIRAESGTWVAAKRQQAFSYDADGNLTEDGLWRYTYDAENRLVRMTSLLPAGFGATLDQVRRRLDFKYDYQGRRIEKRVTDLDTSAETLARRFVYDGWNLVAELDALSSSPFPLTRTYAWGLDLTGDLAKAGGVGALLSLTNYTAGTPGTTYYPAYDGNGNVAALVNAGSGALAAVYEYDGFGNAIRTEVSDAAVTDNPFRFSTKYADKETGLVYYGHRYYSPTLGRFINRDPIEEAGGLNLYGFVGNNGVNRWDYLGMDADGLSDEERLARLQAHNEELARYEEMRKRVDAVYGQPANWDYTGYGSSIAFEASAAWADYSDSFRRMMAKSAYLDWKDAVAAAKNNAVANTVVLENQTTGQKLTIVLPGATQEQMDVAVAAMAATVASHLMAQNDGSAITGLLASAGSGGRFSDGSVAWVSRFGEAADSGRAASYASVDSAPNNGTNQVGVLTASDIAKASLSGITIKGGADIGYYVGSSATVSRPVTDATGGKAAVDATIGGGAIAYAGFEGKVPLFQPGTGRTFSFGGTLAAGLALGGSLELEIRQQPLFTAFGRELSLRYIVPTSINPFLGIGFGGSLKLEKPTPSTTLIDVNVDQSGNITAGGLLGGL